MVTSGQEKYDYIFSLGGSCAAAAQLCRRKLRPFSTPLDWIGPYDERTFRYLPTGLKTRFADFAKKENLSPFRTDLEEIGWTPYRYLDELLGYMLVHHFDGPIDEPGIYEAFISTCRRRFDRLFSAIDSADSVLFILATFKTHDSALINPIYDTMRELWPDKRIALRAIQFSAEEDQSEPDKWGGGGLYRYKRKHNVYEFTETNWEWSFLDAFVGKPKELRKPRGLARLAYKIGKHIKKSLVRKGYDVGF